MPKKAAPKPVDELSCALCKGVEGLDLSEFKKHRADVHDAPDTSGLRMKMVLHLDGDDYFASTYEIVEGRKVVGSRFTSQPRRGENKRMWDAAG